MFYGAGGRFGGMTEKGYGVRWQGSPDLGVGRSRDPANQLAMALSAKVMRVLNDECFHPDWCVETDYQQGLVKINLRSLMGDTEFMTVKIEHLECDPTFNVVKRLAGLLLERFSFSRTGFSEADFNAALQRNPIGYRGRPHVFLTPG